ncbi:MAG: hypothetical protein IPM16_16835 [Chloroflexi bacterium]|nr:hypothetical protein [Chloroflexota bacterium]
MLLLVWFAFTTGIASAQDDASSQPREDCSGLSFPYTLTGDSPAELINAIECANANGTADVIDLNGQTIVLTEAYADYDGATGLPEVTTEITIQNGTIERLFSENEFRLLAVDEVGRLTTNGVTLRRGCMCGYSYEVFYNGGAIYNAGFLHLFNSNLGPNVAETYGGAVYNTGTLIIGRVTLSNNRAARGGAIYNVGSLTVVNSAIIDNNASRGAGIYNFGQMTVTAARLAANYATNAGGAIYNIGPDEVSITDTEFTDNPGPAEGGAISNWSTSTLTVTGSTFTRNGLAHFHGTLTVIDSAIYSGGFGIVAYAPVTVVGSTIAGNTLGFYHGWGAATIANSAITGNGFGVGSEFGTLHIVNSTIAGNDGTTYGGIYIRESAVTLDNSIVYGNEADSDSSVPQITGAYTANNSLIGVDPLFVAPELAASAPTTAGDYRLLAGSPAIDAGDKHSSQPALQQISTATRGSLAARSTSARTRLHCAR